MNCFRDKNPLFARFDSGRICNAFLLLSIPTLMCGAGPSTNPSTRPTTSPALVKFTSDEFGFSLRHPADWIIPEHPVNGQLFSAQTPEYGDDKPRISASTQPAHRFGVVGLKVDASPDSTSDPEILKDVSGAMAVYIFNHGGKNLKIKNNRLGVFDARQLRFDTDQPDGPISTVYIIAVYNKQVYVLNAAAPTDHFDELMKQVELVIQSFKARPK